MQPRTIERATSNLDDDWDEFVRANGGTVEYSSKHRRLMSQLLGDPELEESINRIDWSLCIRENGVIKAVMPLFVQTGPYGRVANSLPYFGGRGGILGEGEPADALAGMYIGFLHGAAAGTVVENPLIRQQHGRIPYGYVSDRIGHYTDIAYSEDHEARLLASYETRARGSIRKASSVGVRVRRDAGALEWLVATHQANMRAVDAPLKNERFFELVTEVFDAGDEYDVYVAELDGRPVAAALLFFFNGDVEYITPALDVEARPMQPLSLLLHRALVDASQAGFTLWNWGASQPEQMQLRLFKRQWAAVERPFRYLTAVTDTTILERTADELLDAYPSFFVVPFEHLR